MPDWLPVATLPPQAGYFLITFAPINWAELPLEVAQDYSATMGSSLAWYNPSTGWFRARPGSGKFENIDHAVTHWAQRPEGARPTADQFAALPNRRWVPWWGPTLRDIGKSLVFSQYAVALDQIENQLIPLIREKLDA